MNHSFSNPSFLFLEKSALKCQSPLSSFTSLLVDSLGSSIPPPPASRSKDASREHVNQRSMKAKGSRYGSFGYKVKSNISTHVIYLHIQRAELNIEPRYAIDLSISSTYVKPLSLAKLHLKRSVKKWLRWQMPLSGHKRYAK